MMRLLSLLLSLLTGLLWSLDSSAEDTTHKIVRLAWVHPGSPDRVVKDELFWVRLRALGWEEGRNLQVERRYAQGRMEAFPGFMAEMVRQKVDIIVTISTPGALAASKATTTIPIVVASMGDPVANGLVSNLARPGGNLTGGSAQIGEGIPSKWLELLKETVPQLSTVAVLSNPTNPISHIEEDRIAAAALARSLKTVVLHARALHELEPIWKQARQRAQAIVVLPDPLFIRYRHEVVAMAAKLQLPAIYGWDDFVVAGGLMSYSPDGAEVWDRAAVYVDKILRGTKSGDLPIAQPTRFSLAANLKTAKALGLTIPESILLRADEVIR